VVDGSGEKWETAAGQPDRPAEEKPFLKDFPDVSDLPDAPFFTGRYAHTLDDKRRVAIPKAFRALLKVDQAPTLFVIPAFSDKCLYLYSAPQFIEVKTRLEALAKHTYGVGDEKTRAFKRQVFSRCVQVSPDKQGRIALPVEVCKFVGIDKEIVFLGVDDHIELWSEKAEQLKDNPEEFRRISKELLG
jgi:MraZ protein